MQVPQFSLLKSLRQRWPVGNDKTARVLVPLSWLKPARRQAETFREEFREGFPEFLKIVSALEGAIAAAKERTEADAVAVSALTKRAEAAESRADRAEQGRDAERTRADALRDQIDDLHAKLTDAQTELAAAQDQAEEVNARAVAAEIAQAEAEADAAELRQTEAERRARGLLARLRQAWRGE